MTQPPLERLESVFQDAADLPADRRAVFLDDACAGDTALRDQVERLLVRMQEDGTFGTPGERPDRFGRAAFSEGPGSTIGRYKLLQVIGEGGFGVVYMAEQTEPVQRKVALKIIKLGMDTREVVARFEAERQALALMDHPNIARVLDGGATESGRPYFVMELVRGVSVTEYCRREELSPADRLSLFLTVCDAVQHAHQKGVIHRDLKPTNVLVTSLDGRPVAKVIDFGVAKAMHGRLTEKTLFTRYEQFIGTPAYMSPEQAELSALDVDTRTDIYALGVLLYELLTGTTPFDDTTLREAGLAEIQRIIREETPPRPSVRVTTRAGASAASGSAQALLRHLRGDLDWIVMKAIEKDRTRRYGTANELADDIRRHLRHEPVIAGPPGALYRTTKLLARHRPFVLSAAAVLVVLIAGLVTTSLARLEAEENAELARDRAEHALNALSFLDSTLAITNPEVALTPDLSIRAILDGAAARVADAFAGQPWAELRVRATIGRAYAALSENQLADPHLRRAVELYEQLGGAEAATQAGFDGGDAYAVLWALTNVAFHLDRPDAFEIAARAQRVGLDYLAEDYPAAAQALRDFARGIDANAWSQDTAPLAGLPAQGDAAYRVALRDVPRGDRRWPIVADTYLAAGYMLWYTPHETQSEGYWRVALEIQCRELPAEHPDIAATVGLIVGMLARQGRGEDAEVLMRESIAALLRVHAPGSYPVAVAEGSLGAVLVQQGRYAEAEQLLLRSHDVIVDTIGSESKFMAVEATTRLAHLYFAWGRPRDAEPYRASIAQTCADYAYGVAWGIAEYAFGDDDAPIVEAMGDLDVLCAGFSYRVADGTKDDPAAAELVQRILDLVDRLDPEDDRVATAARLLVGWARALDPISRVHERRVIGEAAYAMLAPWADARRWDRADALGLVIEADVVLGHADEAATRAREMATMVRTSLVDGNWIQAAIQARVGRALARAGRNEDAVMVLEPAHRVLATQLGPDHADTVAARPE